MLAFLHFFAGISDTSSSSSSSWQSLEPVTDVVKFTPHSKFHTTSKKPKLEEGPPPSKKSENSKHWKQT